MSADKVVYFVYGGRAFLGSIRVLWGGRGFAARDCAYQLLGVFQTLDDASDSIFATAGPLIRLFAWRSVRLVPREPWPPRAIDGGRPS